MPHTGINQRNIVNSTGHNMVAYLRGDKIVNDRKRTISKEQGINRKKTQTCSQILENYRRN